jgi:transcriptional regulator GlxA family with amidase domain
MKRVCFLLPNALLKPASLFSAIEILEQANEYSIRKTGRAFFKIEIAGIAVRQALVNGQFVLGVTSIYNLVRPDLIIIPGVQVMDEQALEQNKELINWIAEQQLHGTEVASMCTGSFLLAATELVNGKECATHWESANNFRKLFPHVNLRIDKILTDNKGVYTAGGAFSSLNLILYLVEKFNGREAAVYCAKVLHIDLDRDSQSPFVIFEQLKNHDDEEIKKVQFFIEKNLEEKITIEDLSDRFAIARRSLVRRFKKATNNPPIEYIQRIKIEAAKRRLEQKRKTINEVMYSVGYTDVKAFRNVFKKITGLSPIEYRNKFATVEL